MNLEPLRQALLASVEAEARTRQEHDDAEAASRLEAARHEAEALVDQGRRQGERAAQREAARTRASAVRSAREARLGSQRTLVDELRSRSLEAVGDLPGRAGYPTLLERLSEAARRQLGPEAVIEPNPAGLGGIRGRAGARSVDYTLPTLVERAVESLGEEIERLWR